MSQFLISLTIGAIVGLILGALSILFSKYVLRIKNEKKIRIINALCIVTTMSLLNIEPIRLILIKVVTQFIPGAQI
ncbi:hypothetical protein M899_0956 [Bacteriovorax sp. BSW11_IV]|uniref:hypothetical protein n=1 Tax=Bacteriovorax sp. BSW11_IV TaxID=1353529 RepID=UPI000389FB54|nr:hypothetical protein [Bacteriovorax sp. BSW11_IV]EQC48720.1 hypothetical protein M899_0956 [Bacteriovorax sp. BSW11_IV]